MAGNLSDISLWFKVSLECIEETDDAAPCEIGRLGIVIGQAGVRIEVACTRIGEDIGRDL